MNGFSNTVTLNNLQRGILFLGDSFTWGEGLELYCDTAKWISERNHINTWQNLRNKQDSDGTDFRKNNRYPGIVARHFNTNAYIDDNNGGYIQRYLETANQHLLNPDLYIDTIVIQFSIISRDPLHSTLRNCKCMFCTNIEYYCVYEDIENFLYKLMYNIELSELDKETLHIIENSIKMQKDNPNFIEKVQEQINNSYQSMLDNFYLDYVKFWQAGGKRKIYVIDSWDTITSKFILNSEFNNYKIPLIGKDNKKYYTYETWKNTFKFKEISHEFKGCGNGHPTLEQHQYLAKSVIQAIENRR